MDFLANHETINHLLLQYGSLALFALLALGIIALPVPEETMMVFAGVLMGKGHLPIHETILAALAGSITGITVSYLMGATAGHYILTSYGPWIGITQKRYEQAHNWFEKYGKWSLFIGYFIPGVRHFTGFSAGTTGLKYREFALFSYTGALFWVSTFLSIGYFFGPYWVDMFEKIEFSVETTALAMIAVILAVLGFIFLRKKFHT